MQLIDDDDDVKYGPKMQPACRFIKIIIHTNKRNFLILFLYTLLKANKNLTPHKLYCNVLRCDVTLNEVNFVL